MRSYEHRASDPQQATLLKAYEFLRGEVNSTLAAQLQILSFGTATLGLVSGAAFIGPNGAFRSDVLVVFLPLLAYLTLTIWFAEVMRMLRAGAFLLTLEKRLDDQGDGSLNWEASVWRGRLRYAVDPQGHLRQSRVRPYYSIFDPDQLRLFSVTLLFFTIAGSSIAMGWPEATLGQRWFAVGAGILALLVVVLLYHLRLDQVAEILNVEERPAVTRAIAWVAESLVRDTPEASRAPAAPNP
jgi:hypothetical protein